MKFTTKITIQALKEGMTYTGVISRIEETTTDKKTYYKVTIELDKGFITIWVNDDVNPEHPMFDVFNEFVTEENAADFNVQEIEGIAVRFTVKNLLVQGKNGEVERSFFQKVTPIFEGEEE